MSRYLALAGCHICHEYDKPVNLYICRYCSKPVCQKDSEQVADSQLKTRACSECLKKIAKEALRAIILRVVEEKQIASTSVLQGKLREQGIHLSWEEVADLRYELSNEGVHCI